MTMQLGDNPAADAWQKQVVVLIAAAVLFLLVVNHVSGINGASYHIWAWRWIEPWRIYPAMLLAVVPFVIAQCLPRDRNAAAAIALLMVSMFLLQFTAAGAQAKPFDPWRIAEVVENPFVTSYYTEAQILATQRPFGRFLEEYPGLMEYFSLHGRQKPPGLILYYYAFLKLFSDHGVAALAGGLFIGAISTLGIPATYLLVRQLTEGDRSAAFVAAGYFSLCPSLVLFFPTFDICYPALTCAMVGLWVQALRTGKLRWAAGMGIVMSFAFFATFNLLVLGALIAGLALWSIYANGRAAIRIVVKASAAALATVAGIYVLMYATLGYNALATFFTAVRNEEQLKKTFYYLRPFPETVPSDVQDFFLASGWISLPFVLFCILRRPIRPMVVLVLLEIGIVAGTGFIQCETARTWVFLLPLIMLPIGVELSRWPTRARMCVYASLWLLTVAIGQNMKFLLE